MNQKTKHQKMIGKVFEWIALGLFGTFFIYMTASLAISIQRDTNNGPDESRIKPKSMEMHGWRAPTDTDTITHKMY